MNIYKIAINKSFFFLQLEIKKINKLYFTDVLTPIDLLALLLKFFESM